MAHFGQVTVRELLEDRALRGEIAEMMGVSEKVLLRHVTAEDEDTALEEFYTPVPASLEGLNVSDARGDDQVVEAIAKYTGLPVEKVIDVLDVTHGRTLLTNLFDFIWLPRRVSPSSGTAPPTRPVEPASPRATFSAGSTARPSIFASYSHKDRKYVDEVRVHLKPLERENALEFWDDSRIKSGEKWRDEIQRAIECASGALLFVSANFLASDFIHSNEIPPLLAEANRRGTVILPLIVGHSRYEQHPVLSTFRAFNSPGQPVGTLGKHARDKLFVKLASELESICARVRMR